MSINKNMGSKNNKVEQSIFIKTYLKYTCVLS